MKTEISSAENLAKFKEFACNMPRTSRVALNEKGKITKIGLWQRFKRFVSVTRGDRGKQNSRLAEILDQALENEYGRKAASIGIGKLTNNPTILSARRINIILNRAEENQPQSLLAFWFFDKKATNDILGIPIDTALYAQHEVVEGQFPIENYLVALAKGNKEFKDLKFASITSSENYQGRSSFELYRGGADWDFYKKKFKCGNIVIFPKGITFDPVEEQEHEGQDLYKNNSIIFITDTHEKAKVHRNKVVFHPDTRFTITGLKFDVADCLQIFLADNEKQDQNNEP